MECPSILFADPMPHAMRHAVSQPAADGVPPAPDCFQDLHLDQIESAVLGDVSGYGLESVFRHPLGTIEAIRYRQDVFRDFANPGIRAGFERFTVAMCEVRRSLSHAALLSQPEQSRMWRLDAAVRYSHAVQALDALLADAPPMNVRSEEASPEGISPSEGFFRSDALRSVSRWLRSQTGSRDFHSFADACGRLSDRVRDVRYTLCCSDNRLHVWRDDGAGDAGSLVGDNLVASMCRTFSSVAPMPPPEPISFFTHLEMGALELQILAELQQLHPDLFSALAAWDRTVMPFPHPDMVRFDRELQFYLAWLHLTDTLADAGCSSTLPIVTEDTALRLHGLYDLALALKMRQPIVPNDCLLTSQERIAVLTGPNQGGKSTFARALGQTAWLAMLGVPVPAQKAVLGRYDAILTHFATAEDPDSASGRLQEELLRVRALLHAVSDRSLVLFNELFATTATQDAIDLGRRVLGQVRTIGCRCLYVTHLSELADPQAGIVSLVAEVASDGVSTRTFRIRRRPADGMAHADSLAARYGLDMEQVRIRMMRNNRQGGVA